MTNDIDIPAGPKVLYIDGQEIGEGSFVAMSDDTDDEAGEVWGVTAGRKVLVCWDIRSESGYLLRQVQEWHDADDLRVVRS